MAMDFYLWTENTSTLNYKESSDQTLKVPTVLEQKRMLYISSCISVIGTVSNLLSLTFFFLNWSNKLGEKLLVLLNVLDLFLCLSATVFLVFRNSLEEEYPNLLTLLNYVYFTSMECTGFVTTLLAVVRSIATYLTFHKVKQRIIAKLFIAYILYAAVKAVLCQKFSYINTFNVISTYITNKCEVT